MILMTPTPTHIILFIDKRGVTGKNPGDEGVRSGHAAIQRGDGVKNIVSWGGGGVKLEN